MMMYGHRLFLLLLSSCFAFINGDVSSGYRLARQHPKQQQNLRTHRSNPYFSSFTSNNASSLYGGGDLMLEDEPSSSGEEDIQEKLVVRGQVVILECLEIDKTRKKLNVKDTHIDAAARWYHEEKEVKPGLRVNWGVEGRLRISHAVSGDSGVWRCKKEGNYRRPLRLVVTIPPEPSFLVYGGAKLGPGARLTTRAGNVLNLHCVVEGGNPAPTIYWFFNDKEITSNSTIRNEWQSSLERFRSVSNVTIDRVTKAHHNASVVCRVVHPALSRPHTSHLKLNIEYPPDFRLRRWPAWGSVLREGSAVSLLCHVDANPPSNPYWIIESDGKEVEVESSSMGWLNFTNVQTSNRGWYKCATNHTFGHFSSHTVFINILPSLAPPTSSNNNDARVGASRVGANSPSSSSKNQHVFIPNYNSKTNSDYLDELGKDSNLRDEDPCATSTGSSSLCLHAISTSSASSAYHDDPKSQQQFLLRQSEGDNPYRNCPPYPEDHDSKQHFIWRSDIKIKVMNRTHAALEGGPAMLTAHVCGPDVTADQITWFPPSKKVPLTPGKAFGRWTPFNLSSPDSQKCVLSNLHIVPVISARDEGEWVILVVNSLSAHAAVVQLNVSTAAKSLAASKNAADANNGGGDNSRHHKNSVTSNNSSSVFNKMSSISSLLLLFIHFCLYSTSSSSSMFLL